MKTEILALVVGVLLASNHATTLAAPGKGHGHDRARVESGQGRHYDAGHARKDRVHSRSRKHDWHGHHAPGWRKGMRHGRDHAYRHWHRGHRWSKHRHHGHYKRYHAPHPRHYRKHHAPHARHYGRYHGHKYNRHHYRHIPHSSLSIILHGHF